MEMMNRTSLKIGNVVISIVTHEYAYCTPRANSGPYTAVEVGLWTKPTDELAEFADGCVNEVGELTVYAYVPTEVLGRYIASLTKKK